MKKPLKLRKIKEAVISGFSILVGCTLYSFSLNFFIKANGLASGGFTGIGLLLNYGFNFSIGTFIMIANIPLLIAGGIIWKRDFIIKTILGVVGSSVLVDLFSFASFPVDNPLLAAIYGGIFSGVGTGIIIRNGGTMGGTDILGRIFYKFKGISMGSFYIFFDTCVLAAVAIIHGLEVSLYSMFTVFISSKVVDTVVDGLDKGKQVLIITNETDKIIDYIKNSLHRGSTILEAKGGYNYDPRQIVLCTVKRWETFKFRKEIMILDPHAFIIINDAYEVYGLGFKDNN